LLTDEKGKLIILSIFYSWSLLPLYAFANAAPMGLRQPSSLLSVKIINKKEIENGIVKGKVSPGRLKACMKTTGREIGHVYKGFAKKERKTD